MFSPAGLLSFETPTLEVSRKPLGKRRWRKTLFPNSEARLPALFVCLSHSPFLGPYSSVAAEADRPRGCNVKVSMPNRTTSATNDKTDQKATVVCGVSESRHIVTLTTPPKPSANIGSS